MCSKSYWAKKKQKRSTRGMRGAAARWEKYHAAMEGEPVREDRYVEIMIRDSHRPMTRLMLRREKGGAGRWGRWKGLGDRALGWSGIGRVIGMYLE